MSETPEQQAAETTEATGGETLLEQVMRETKITPTDEWYAPARDGMAAFFADLVKTAKPGEKVHPSRIDKMIADIDAKLTAQLNQILHAPTFQRLESSWRSLKFLIDRTDFRENNKIELLNVAKSELADDFDDAPEMTKSGLYKHVYVAEYGQHGGEPVASIIANYEFDASSPDMHLLQQLASVASMAHAPSDCERVTDHVRHQGLGRVGRAQGLGLGLRGAEIYQMGLVSRIRGRPLCRLGHAAFHAACALPPRKQSGARI